MKSAVERYRERMERVLDHIERHLDDDLDVAALSAVAAFSKHHFHRQFTAAFKVPVHRYVQLARLKRASYRLAFRGDASVTGIAMDAGYDAPDAFARAFRKRFGQVPSAFRQAPDWETWHAALGPLHRARSKRMQTTYSAEDVTIREVPPTPVAFMEHRGDPQAIGATIQRFIGWRREHGLHPRVSATFNLFHSDPRTTPPAEYRLSLCAATPGPVAPNEAGVEAGMIPGGRCAVLRVVGTSDDLEPAALFLYRDWLPASGEELRDFPLYCQGVCFFREGPVRVAVTDVFLPLE